MNTEAPAVNPVLQNQPPHPLLVVISGPSGVGKDSVLNGMRARGIPFHFVVTMNSRPPRPDEVDGRDYHFVTPQQFEQQIAAGELLEWAQVYDQYKGVPRFEVRRAIASGRDVVLRVNIDGAATIRRLVPEALLIFLAPASPAELEARLQRRHTESASEMAHRLAIAERELHEVVNFDYVIVNHEGQLDATINTVCSIMQAEKQRVFPRRIASL